LTGILINTFLWHLIRTHELEAPIGGEGLEAAEEEAFESPRVEA